LQFSSQIAAFAYKPEPIHGAPLRAIDGMLKSNLNASCSAGDV
jgi:hypothetical protein